MLDTEQEARARDQFIKPPMTAYDGFSQVLANFKSLEEHFRHLREPQPLEFSKTDRDRREKLLSWYKLPT